jgi:antitoxin component YwqK of YwqJK toxin-antitoxin module
MRTFYLLLPWIAWACTGNNATTPDAAATDSQIPADAVREKFVDNPRMEKISRFDAQGQLTNDGILLDGHKEGVWTEFHSNGTVKSTTAYINGKKEGWSVVFNDNGQLISQVMYHNDLLHGEYRTYSYPTLTELTLYREGKKEGMSKIYYTSGKIQQELIFKNGIQDGVSRYYNEEGKMTIEYEYKEGKLINQ